ncbi:probable G-protein coupled receptor 179 [Erinaceus europaeus]|uniref:Probable G-protein coupled receptor 179 n=1 Tax=Erinaceus europaeus TaxID=9365 RepID=A0A1S3A8E0_ERIEU|nr:probable G-protein coupled receptor 179 [Erinaceus europaeus]
MPSPVWGLLGCCLLCSWAPGEPRPLRSLLPMSPQVRVGFVPTQVPSERVEAALAFLYSGDAQQLSGANCSQRYEAQGAGARPGLPPVLRRAANTLTQAVNFLNLLLQANDIRESSIEEDVEWYQALVRSVAEGDPKVYRALLTFNRPPGASHLQLALQATRLGEETVLRDLSQSRVQEESPTGAPETLALQKRVLTNDLGSLDSPKWPRGDGYVSDMQHVRVSPPFLECQGGQLHPGWLITLSATFYGLKPDLTPEVRGQVQMDINLQSVDINQCASGPGWYSNTHLCDLNSTQCISLEGQGFVLGHYLCHCRPGFYGASHSGGLEENAVWLAGQFGSALGGPGRLLRCLPCAEGCSSCMDGTPCLVEEALALRAAVLACQASCMLAVFLSMLASYRCRRSKMIRASGVVLLETILFGSLLLYFPVFILYFKPSVFRCIALRWVRLLGFAIVYGTIILKLYRVLQLFLSPSAQRGPHLSSGRLLRSLSLLLLLVLGFLAVWTAGTLERNQHLPLVIRGHTPTGRHFYLCHHDRWDYIMVVAEMLLLCWGSFLCYATRAVPSAFHEPRYMGVALHNELLLSAAFHAARFVLVPSLHPDWTLLLFFFHTHSTVTTTLALIFIPKFRKPGAPSREEMVDEVYEDELDLQCSGSYLNSSITSAWSQRSLDPGDIRDELKKLYAQLEVHKTKEMTANNPHLPKKCGSSRQGLGRSFMRYLAEFPEALARQHSRDSGSLGHSSLPGSSRRWLLSSSLQEPEGPPGLRKSHSTYEHDHHREQDPPLLDSLLKRKLAKKVSRESWESSVEGTPVLGFRSASAHNLTVGERLPRARPTSLQKSLSVVAGSREKALLVASQTYLEETYRQAKEQEERKKAEAAMASPVRGPSARRLERVRGAPLSAPPSPAKSKSADSSHTSGKLQEEAGKRLPHPPIRHQVSTPTLALSGGACLGEPRMLSPTSTWTPALMPALAPALAAAPAPALAPAPAPALFPAPVLALAPVPVPPQSPSLLTYICPWESVELPTKKENAAQEGPTEPERDSLSPAPARARLWRALSVAIERKGAGDNVMDTEDMRLQGDTDNTDEDRPKVFSKSHSLKTPVQQGSVRSLGLAIKALTRSRSSYREKEREEATTEGNYKGGASEKGTVMSPRSPKPGRPRAVSKQAALSTCEDEESLQNQQNAYTSRMLRSCQQEDGKGQEDRGRRAGGEGKAEKAVKAALRQVRQGTAGDKNSEQVKEAPMGWQKPLPKVSQQSLRGADHSVAEVCPWEAAEFEGQQSDSSKKAEICPWEVSGGTPQSRVVRQERDGYWGEKEKDSEKPEPKGIAAIAQKKPERLVRGQEAMCPWENANSRDQSPQADRCQQEATAPEACAPAVAKAELCPWEETVGGENGKASLQGVTELPQEKQKPPRKAPFWKDQTIISGDLESICPWERTDFRGPSAVPDEASGTPGCSGSLDSSVKAGEAPAVRKAEICPWELGDRVTGEERLTQGAEKELLGKGSFEKTREQTGQAVQKLNQSEEVVCPWESTAPGHPSPCLDNSSSRHSKGESIATKACLQEDLRPEVEDITPAKAEVCPWETDERTKGSWTSGQEPRSESPKDKEKIPAGFKDATDWGKSPGQIQTQEAVCPWEIVDPGSFTQQPGPQDIGRTRVSLQIASSVSSKAAEVCPWDTEEALHAEKTEICPWEGTTGAGEGAGALGVEVIRKLKPNDLDSRSSKITVTVPKTPERPTQEWEVACPQEIVDTRQPSTVDTEREKANFQELDYVGCKPAEVCPWEVEEASSGETAKICPWEVSEGTAGEAAKLNRSGSAEQRGKTLGQGGLASLGEDKSKWEMKQSQEQEAICPWEEDLRGPYAQGPQVSDPSNSVSSNMAGTHSLEVSEEAAEIGDQQQDPKMSEGRAEYTSQSKVLPSPAGNLIIVTTTDGTKTAHKPQDSLVLAASFTHPDCECPELWETSSQRPLSTGIQRAELLPGDTPTPGAHKSDSRVKAEAHPREVIERTSGEEVARDYRKGKSWEKGKGPEELEHRAVAVQGKPERADGKQETVCLWEGQDGRTVSPQTVPQASDQREGSSEAVGGVGAKAADECLWEAAEAPSANKTEVCAWEESEGAAEKGGLDQEVDGDSQGQAQLFLQKAGSRKTEEHTSKAAAKVSRELGCPWEGLGSGESFLQPGAPANGQPKASLHRESSVGSKMAEVCQWEITDPEGNKLKGTMEYICPWEGTGAFAEETGLLALRPIQTETATPTAPEKLPGLSVHRPSGSFLPESKSPRPEANQPAGTFTQESVREFHGPSGLGAESSLTPEPTLQETEAHKCTPITGDQEEAASTIHHKEPAPPTVSPWE